MFDLSIRQIAQQTIPEEVRGKVNGQWKSMTSFFDMSSYVVAVFFPNPNQFWLLTTISATMVFLAMITYTLTNPALPFYNTIAGYVSKSAALQYLAEYQMIDKRLAKLSYKDEELVWEEF